MAELPQDLTVLNDGCLAALAETARRFVAEYVVQRATET